MRINPSLFLCFFEYSSHMVKCITRNRICQYSFVYFSSFFKISLLFYPYFIHFFLFFLFILYLFYTIHLCYFVAVQYPHSHRQTSMSNRLCGLYFYLQSSAKPSPNIINRSVTVFLFTAKKFSICRLCSVLLKEFRNYLCDSHIARMVEKRYNRHCL